MCHGGVAAAAAAAAAAYGVVVDDDDNDDDNYRTTSLGKSEAALEAKRKLAEEEEQEEERRVAERVGLPGGLAAAMAWKEKVDRRKEERERAQQQRAQGQVRVLWWLPVDYGPCMYAHVCMGLYFVPSESLEGNLEHTHTQEAAGGDAALPRLPSVEESRRALMSRSRERAQVSCTLCFDCIR